MALGDGAASSPTPNGFDTLQDELAYYKRQYEHLEAELQDFQASSRELEAELEKDVEASERRERNLREKVESLTYEVGEWKTKHKQSKTEANNAQNSLQKEITSLRDESRTQQLRLRDIEVANDDFERQARNTTSSLDDLESKYNQAIERGVMLEEEMKSGEQEREALRIETQRLRDELSDLKIEADITQEKLRAAENASIRQSKTLSQLSEGKDQDIASAISEGSATSASVPSTYTPPPTTSDSSLSTSDAITPPSPALSAQSGSKPSNERPSVFARLSKDTKSHATTPRPPPSAATPRAGHARTPSRLVGRPPPPPKVVRTPLAPPRQSGIGTMPLERSGSLYQIRGLIGKMQKLEQRVQSARSKLPAPSSTPPRASPRGTSTLTQSSLAPSIPSTVTVRSSKKRSSVSTAQSATPSKPTEQNTSRISRRQSRISFGGSMTAPGAEASRPSSRASLASNGGFVRPSSRIETSVPARPPPESHRPASAADTRRPRSSLGGRATPSYGHRPSMSMQQPTAEDDEDFTTPTPARTKDKGGTAIHTPQSLHRRQSTQALGLTDARRRSLKVAPAGPPLRTPVAGTKGERETRESIDIGETF